MKIVVVGAGPGGLYFAISAKRRDPGIDITVLDRAPEGATYGWGVVYWDNLLDMLFGNDFESARQIRAESQLWQEQDVWLGDQVAYLPGYGYSITRLALLRILTARARALGVEVIHNQPVTDPDTLGEVDLIVGADGAASTTRERHAAALGTQLREGHNQYLWLGTSKVFSRFTFAFEPTEAGWIWFHAYPSSPETSTCIVECAEPTWAGLGFAERGGQDTLGMLEKIFHTRLDGHPLITGTRDGTLRWQRFTEITNQTWGHNNLVLLGDAAHTTHFTIGSGTRLAMIDAVTLAQALYDHPGHPATAAQRYDQRRRAALAPTQASARASMTWFEHVDNYAKLHPDVVEFAYSMSSRQGEQPPWRYQKHVAHQTGALRLARRHYDSTRRWFFAARRGQQPLLPHLPGTARRGPSGQIPAGSTRLAPPRPATPGDHPAAPPDRVAASRPRS